ncbi:MAG TPA: class I SAM-dependent methyltransferase [bacterium]|nr:class I SAM-dependent methyltransferase [bacterium]
MDAKTRQTRTRWDALSKAGVACARPSLKMTKTNARRQLDPEQLLGDITGKHVLCLASGGGQQSVAFAMLGAIVTVVDLSSEQLKGDKLAAKKMKLAIKTIQADMRDLSILGDSSFDIIYQPYSINYVRSVEIAFDEVTRLLKPNGIYHLMFHNPFVHGSWKDGCWGSAWKTDDLWHGKGYPLWQRYREGEPIRTDDPRWHFEAADGKQVALESPQEYKHTLSTIINGLIKRGLTILKFKEYTLSAGKNKPGSWEHYASCAAPWLFLWCQKSQPSSQQSPPSCGFTIRK